MVERDFRGNRFLYDILVDEQLRQGFSLPVARRIVDYIYVDYFYLCDARFKPTYGFNSNR